MTEDPTSALLERVAGLLGYRAILWRGAEPGSDVDLLVLDSALPELSRLLTEAGLHAEAGDPGHVVWMPSSPGGGPLPLDILAFSSWPSHYPSLPGVMSRLQTSEAGPPVASAADRALIFAAEAVGGRPVEKVVDRIRPLLEGSGFPDDLRQVAAGEDLEALADLIGRPDALTALARRGRLPYPRAAALAVRSAAARAAVGARVAARLAEMASGPSRGRRRRAGPGPLLVTVSGMDGAGKSTAAGIIEARLRAQGLPAAVIWARIGGESALLNRLATPVKRVLRRSGTVADPVAAGGPGIEKVQDPREAGGRRRLVSWAWIVIVATANALSYRRAASERRRGMHVICDRWATDAFVDLELRYGRHRVAEAMLRHLSPERDLGILLEVDARTAALRKPGDQAEHVLAAMEPLYARRAREEGLVRIDSRRPPADIEQTLSAVVDALLATR